MSQNLFSYSFTDLPILEHRKTIVEDSKENSPLKECRHYKQLSLFPFFVENKFSKITRIYPKRKHIYLNCNLVSLLGQRKRSLQYAAERMYADDIVYVGDLIQLDRNKIQKYFRRESDIDLVEEILLDYKLGFNTRINDWIRPQNTIGF